MIKRTFIVLGSLVWVLLLTTTVLATDIDLESFITITQINDQRSKKWSNVLTLDLSLDCSSFGQDSARVEITKAVDNTGYNLLGEQTTFNPTFASYPEVKSKINLKNPPRHATMIKELSGIVRLYVYDRDPDSIVKITDIVNAFGQTVDDERLKENNIKIVLLTYEQYEIAKTDPILSSEIGEMITTLSNLGFSSQHDIALAIQDPDEKITKREFVNSNGEAIRSNRSTSMGQTYIFNLNNALDENTSLLIYLATDQVEIAIPFTLNDIVLP